MEKEVGDLLCPVGSQSFLLPPKLGYILSVVESPNFTDPRRGEWSGRKDKQEGREGPYTLPTPRCALTPDWRGGPAISV